MTTNIALLQRLPELDPTPTGAHAAVSCGVTCPLFTSDSIPSTCC